MTAPAWLPAHTVYALGWTLIHFLWQGLVLAALLEAVLPALRGARARHDLALATLAAMLLAPPATFLFLSGDAAAAPLDAPFPAGLAWINGVVLAWGVGALLCSLRSLRAWHGARTLRRRDVLALPEDLAARCRELLQRLAISWPVRFLQSHRVNVPTVVGWLRPMVLVPVSAIVLLPPQQLEVLILHELAHVRRHDALFNLLLIAAETVLFYHPAVWWVSRRIRIERENCCDDLAVSRCGDVLLYAEALASLESWRSASAMVLVANGAKLQDRIARLLGARREARRTLLPALSMLLLAGLFAGTMAAARVPPPSAVAPAAPRVFVAAPRPAAPVRPVAVDVTLIPAVTVSPAVTARTASPRPRTVAVAVAPSLPPQDAGEPVMAPADEMPPVPEAPVSATPAPAPVTVAAARARQEKSCECKERKARERAQRARRYRKAG